MTRDAKGRPPSDPPADAEEIEILEVSGMPNDGEASAPDEVDVVFEEKAEPGEPEPAAAAPSEEEESRERLLRLQAEFENLKKRVEREQAEFQRAANVRLLTALLPVLDNFERALATETTGGDEAAFRSGIDLIHRQMIEALRKEGLRAVEALGCPFDPLVHEAVAADAASGLPPNVVIEEYQRGYWLHERLLRPALVRVSLDADAAPEDGTSGEVR